MPVRVRRKSGGTTDGEAGSVLVELAMCITIIWLPLFLGTLLFGFNLIRAIEVSQVCRDAGHMYAFGTDFSQPASKKLVARLAPTLGMTATGGQGVVILSTVTYADSTLCKAAGRQPNAAECPNLGRYVFTARTVIGAPTVHTSLFGTPSPGIIGSDGRIAAADYLTSGSAVANGFASVVALQSSSQFAYVSEMWVKSTDFNFWDSIGPVTVAARSVF
jgi:hypothetical protein